MYVWRIQSNTDRLVFLRNLAKCTIDDSDDLPYWVVAEPLGEAGNRGARSHNAFVCMYVCMYIYIYISVPVNYCHLDRLHNRQDGAAD